jgi:heme/copper-type cytochrome/quinol oxidase subunit 1
MYEAILPQAPLMGMPLFQWVFLILGTLMILCIALPIARTIIFRITDGFLGRVVSMSFASMWSGIVSAVNPPEPPKS